MFAFFINDVFFSFWSNDVGDVFFDKTCKSMKWDSSKVDLVYYKNLVANPKAKYECNLEECEEFIGKKSTSKYSSEIFVSKGEKLINC